MPKPDARDSAIVPRVAKAPRGAHPLAPPESPTITYDTEVEPVVTFSTKLPKGLQLRFKTAAAAHGIKMQDATAQAVAAWIEAHPTGDK